MRELCLSCVYKSLMAVGLVQKKNPQRAFWRRANELGEGNVCRDADHSYRRRRLWTARD
jgi:hypothetical protein